jgi:hypothetical protein
MADGAGWLSLSAFHTPVALGRKQRRIGQVRQIFLRVCASFFFPHLSHAKSSPPSLQSCNKTFRLKVVSRRNVNQSSDLHYAAAGRKSPFIEWFSKCGMNGWDDG